MFHFCFSKYHVVYEGSYAGLGPVVWAPCRWSMAMAGSVGKLHPIKASRRVHVVAKRDSAARPPRR